MSKHNYSQYSNKNNKNNKKEVNTPPVIDNTVEIQNGATTAAVAEVVETTLENKSVSDTDVTVTTLENKSITEPEVTVTTGVVAKCAKLNVRSKPNTNGDVVTILNVGDKISIDVDKSTDEWFKICTINGIDGFCMRKFVNANI